MFRFLRFSASSKCSTLVSTGENLDMMNTSAPRLKILPATYPSIPATKVTTAITAATPITIARVDSTERSLFAHSDCKAIRMASAMFMNSEFGFRSGNSSVKLSLPAEPSHNPETVHRKPDARCRTPHIAYNDQVGSWTGRSLSASSDAGRGKSELHRAVCRITSGRAGSSPFDGKCHRKHTACVFTDVGKGEKVR